MGDNVSITAGSGTTIAADEVTRNAIAEKQQIIKLSLGAEGAFDNLVDSGQQAMAASVPVAIASDQASIPVAATLQANSGVDIGKLTANQSVNVAQINGVTPLMGAGNTGTGSQRVTIASDQAVIPISDNAGSLTVDYATTGSGTATGALRVELPTNGTGVVGLNAGTNAIGKLAANSGVDIGDVDVTTVGTVTPGTAASSLGKAEDAAHSSGDVGVFDLAVSNENRTAFGAASGDYAPKAVNRYGEQYVTGAPPSTASSNGTPITATTTSVIAAPSAGNHLRIVGIHMSNGGSTSCWVAIRDGAAGTRHYNTYLPQNGVISKNINFIPIDLTTATRLDIFLSAAGSVEYEISYYTVAD